MDKYTVDLDQVLNDFEYSELTTDTEDVAASSTTHFRPSKTTSLAKTYYSNAKHSMNNVFSSLNEYLNTDIARPQEKETDKNTALATPIKRPLESLISQPISLKLDEAQHISDSLQILQEVNEMLKLELEEENEEPEDEDTIDGLADVENASYIEEEMTEVKKETSEEVNEDEEVEKAEKMIEKEDEETESCDTKAMVSFHDFRVDDEDAAKYLDDLRTTDDEAEGETSSNDHEQVAQIEKSVETCEAARPNSLEIKEEPVNLIGEPGSTPYNNVYAQSTSQAPANTESESSASISPTFSEASTDSVRSNGLEAQLQPSDTADEAQKTLAEPESDPIPHIDDEDVYVDLDSITPHTVSDQADQQWLGKQAPLWIPDADALCCQHCDLRFTVIKRRHHCRACGLVLCSKCCSSRCRLEYLNAEARVCTRCRDQLQGGRIDTDSGSGGSPNETPQHSAEGGARDQPNPNNPMEYCSVVPPHQQVAEDGGQPPSVMVPVGVLKRKGSNKKHNKSVMFCDGIRPGSDLTMLDNDFNYNEAGVAASVGEVGVGNAVVATSSRKAASSKVNKNLPLIDAVTQSFIPESENCLPPTVTTFKSDITYSDCGNTANVVEMLKNETLTFAVQRNLHIHVRIIQLDCCMQKCVWCFSTEGLISVGQDEIVILLECLDGGETSVPKDVFHHLNNVYNSAVKGTTVTELGLSLHPTSNFLESRNHAGFIFVRPTFQCLQHVIVPKEPYLVGILVHRWETPWARIFPLRLVLRLGAEYRYYPSPLISTRQRDSVFVEIGHTIINLLADFRNFSYTLPNIRGLTIHMEEKCTTVSIPVNRYDQVMKSMSNSSEHILAFGGNFSASADSHLVCIQDTAASTENSYKTHAINIQNKPRKVTGASFIVFNGALKSSSGLTAKSSIVEDGLMIQIPPENMVHLRESLRSMKNHTIQCGCLNAAAADETVNIVWTESDVNFNLGVTSAVDGQSLSGVPSIRVHNGKDFKCATGARLIRWTEVFLLQSGEENACTPEPVDISKVAESISKATCQALVKYLDLLASNHFMKIGIRTTLHIDDVSYAAGSNASKLPPIYMKSLDNELVPVLHRITSAGNVGEGTIVLELIFRVLNV